MRIKLGTSAFVLFFAGLALTVAGYRDTDPEGWFVPFRWFGPVLMGFGGLLAFLVWGVIKD